MKILSSYRTLRLILGDQLNASHSWYKEKDKSVLYLIAELRQETDYVVHHIQKISAFFAGMQQFAQALSASGHHVLHLTLDDTTSYTQQGALTELIQDTCQHYQISHVEYQQPDEYRVEQQLSQYAESLSVSSEGVNKARYPMCCDCVESEHFLNTRKELSQYFSPGKRYKMEVFYRKMRQKWNVLMVDGNPEGGKWNFDADNRNKLKKADIADLPAPLVFSNEVTKIVQRIEKHKINVIGTIEPISGKTKEALEKPNYQLPWPINRQQSLQLLHFFCNVCLPNFGRFQDAMTCESPHQWSLYHSRLSFSLNAKMLHPKQVIDAAVEAYRQSHQEPDIEQKITLAQVEGFIRQILGWREFVRGLYWANMPQYEHVNYFSASRSLPSYFWDANTKMNCIHHAVQQSLDYAYAHHIQRLMITGNFCMLAGIRPEEVDEWYLGIYIDALQWVELPNTRGMSQFADGGWLATKPYAASGSYTNKMSDYCKSCFYSVKEKTGEKACPINSLYWNFIHQHESVLKTNPRMSMIYRVWEKMNESDRVGILERASTLLQALPKL
ncbi:cryptochrome/photolyase family protein [Marinibactrum halimedae]|uniref:Deoxyribodipyrimidine photo-lyase n=1 Tax=Marinibactrum halimedae TaxID=1444977 RepID=A0AA37T1L9_9GAMM|nr:cryptochrome/photolyase family protein [Marinibactrum halimedae]MCD9461036.1 cryptochrome/photolyase family protein [Marinibactrum halimedae]GLS24414.1 deoxyribodipyrimidine photo-lyase [Marinibactrum halimedae]